MWNQGPVSRRYGAFPPIDASQAGSPEMATFITAVYGWMAAGLGLTAFVAWLVSHNTQIMSAVLGSGLIWVFFIAELALVWIISAAVQRIDATVAGALFILYSILNGVTLSFIFLAYTATSVGGTFLVSAGMFAAMTLYGQSTKRNLAGFGNILFMALIGLILASIVNIFFANSMIYWLCTYAGVFIFAGLTAYDTQKLQYMAIQTCGNSAVAARYSIIGALALYLDFINLFLFMLRILGNSGRRR
jgi:FtsH-binding integral membrane protein